MITKRIKEYIDYKGFTISSVEASIGASNGMLRKAFSKNTDIKSQWLENLLENFHEINSYWLITGKGEMIKPKEHQNVNVLNVDENVDENVKNQNNYKTSTNKNQVKGNKLNVIENVTLNSTKPKEQSIVVESDISKPKKQEEVTFLNSNKKGYKTEINQKNKKSYLLKEEQPVLVEATGNANVILLNAQAAASDFSQALTNPVYQKDFETLCLPKFMHRKGTYFAVKISGDSMHPTIKENDIVAGALEPLQDFVGGLVYVFFHESKGLMVKRFHWEDRETGHLCLTSDNEYMDDFFTTVDKIQPYIIKVETIISTSLRNWNSDVRQDIREIKQTIKRLEQR